MEINWYGHAAFRIMTSQGTTVIVDPYEDGAYDGALGYGKIKEGADIIITSHEHPDHNYIKDIPGKFVHINKEGVYEHKDVKIKTMPVFHDTSGGKERGGSLISIIAADDLAIAHMGDLGHALDADEVKKMGHVDIMLLPVGGFFTIDASAAREVMSAVRPVITIPMHYKTEKCGFPITPVDDFVQGQNNVRIADKSRLEITKASLPLKPEIIILKHAL